jgi:hypothetical protein
LPKGCAFGGAKGWWEAAQPQCGAAAAARLADRVNVKIVLKINI